MARFAEPMTRLIDELRKLAGYRDQERTAAGVSRTALVAEDADRLAEAIRDLKAQSTAVLRLQQHHRR